VIESKSRLLAVEVKATPRARLEEGRSLESFLDEQPRSARVGRLLYGGNEVIPLSRRVLAAPVGAVL